MWAGYPLFAPQAVLLAAVFGYSLLYCGRLPYGRDWPAPTEGTRHAGRTHSSADGGLDALVAEHSPEYFVSIRRFTYYGVKAEFAARSTEG
jgi:hypothetical protein